MPRMNAQAGRKTSHGPAVFIVGCARSGTTLLRLMLDSHPSLAIPPETGFLIPIAAERPQTPAELASILTSFHTWGDFSMSRHDFARALEALKPFSSAAGVRSFYELYAEHQGKMRWG